MEIFEMAIMMISLALAPLLASLIFRVRINERIEQDELRKRWESNEKFIDSEDTSNDVNIHIHIHTGDKT